MVGPTVTVSSTPDLRDLTKTWKYKAKAALGYIERDVSKIEQVRRDSSPQFVLQREGALWSLQRDNEPKQFALSVTELVVRLKDEMRGMV